MSGFVPDAAPRSTGFVPDPPAAATGFVPDAQSDVNKPAGAGFVPDRGSSAPTLPQQAQGVVQALGRGKPLGRALKTAPALSGLKRIEQDYRARMDLVRAHPVESFFDLLSTAQRGVGEGVRQLELQHDGQHHDLREQLHAIGESVFMTADPKKNEKIRERTTESVRAAIHAPTHEAIDQWNDKFIPTQIRPYTKAVMKGGEDGLEQMISDPLTLVGSPLVKVATRAVHGMVTSKAMLAAAHATGVSHLFPHLQALHGAYTQAATALGKTAPAQFFRVRPDLDGVFTEEGKKLRLATENSEFSTHARRADIDKAAVQGGTAEARFKQYINAHGNARVQAQLHAIDPAMAQGARAGTGSISRKSGVGNVATALQDFRGRTPEEQAKWLARINDDVRDGEIARRTESLVTAHTPATGAHPFLRGTAPTNWRKVATEDAPLFNPNSIQAKAINAVTAPFRNISKVAIFLNPLPHGMKNVGELAYLAGGLDTVFHGVKAMLPGGIDATMKNRLARMGAQPSYTNHAIDDSIFNKIPGWGASAHFMQDRMAQMEEGWRAGLLHTLDKKLGASKDLKDELMKGYIISDKIGDYRNQSAFVNLFSAIGGPFVAFRLGIVPKNVMAAIKENPARVLAILRTQSDVQHNRSAQGQKKNEVELGGPVGDFARMLPGGGAGGLENPAKFLISPSSLGFLGEVAGIAAHAKDQTLSEFGTETGSREFPLAEPMELAAHALLGNAMPGQQETLTDRLMSMVLESVAVYYYKEQTDKARRLQRQRERKQGL